MSLPHILEARTKRNPSICLSTILLFLIVDSPISSPKFYSHPVTWRNCQDAAFSSPTGYNHQLRECSSDLVQHTASAWNGLLLICPRHWTVRSLTTEMSLQFMTHDPSKKAWHKGRSINACWMDRGLLFLLRLCLSEGKVCLTHLSLRSTLLTDRPGICTWQAVGKQCPSNRSLQTPITSEGWTSFSGASV